MLKRRNFLKASIGTLAIPSFKNPILGSKKPLVISTWDSGIEVNEAAWKVLAKDTGTALDAVEAGAIYIEDVISCCVGLGGNPDRDGHVTLDACIMDHKMNCGGVAFLEGIRHPISVARKVMEDTEHVLLVGEGAQKFALQKGFKMEPEILSADAKKAYEAWLVKSEYKPTQNIELQQKKATTPNKLDNGAFNHDTMALLALDSQRNLGGACTTSGMAFKLRGRVGDSPIIGAGLYVDNAVGAATSSGQGEEVIRIGGSVIVVEFMRQGKTPEQACKMAIERLVAINPAKAKNFQVGFIAINKAGDVGAYAVNPGFVYSLTPAAGKGKVVKAKSYFG
jgi:N4-(beta-N-acetylglucosaminyl)-L-asparaginase